jgi:DNA topoisomerase-3
VLQRSRQQDDEVDEEDLTALPRLKPGDVLKKLGQELVSAKTNPPAPYNDATLLDAMIGAGNLVDDKDLAAHMASRGLGTEATRGETIEKLVRHELVERKKKALLATAKGEALIQQVDPEIADPVLTARWEARLAAIEEGNDHADAFERDVAAYVRELVARVAKTPINKLPDPGLGACPLCKEGVVRATPKGFGCSRWKQGCAFVIWREVAHKTISADLAQELLAHGRTKTLSGFKSKKGSSFKAALRLDDAKKVVFDFA